MKAPHEAKEMEWYEQLRDQHRPEVLKFLLIGESRTDATMQEARTWTQQSCDACQAHSRSQPGFGESGAIPPPRVQQHGTRSCLRRHKGFPLRSPNFRRRVWWPALDEAGVSREVRIHDLRHICASLMIMQGAHAKEIQHQLGHSSISVTLDRYGHLFPDRQTRWPTPSTRSSSQPLSRSGSLLEGDGGTGQ